MTVCASFDTCTGSRGGSISSNRLSPQQVRLSSGLRTDNNIAFSTIDGDEEYHPSMGWRPRRHHLDKAALWERIRQEARLDAVGLWTGVSSRVVQPDEGRQQAGQQTPVTTSELPQRTAHQPQKPSLLCTVHNADSLFAPSPARLWQLDQPDCLPPCDMCITGSRAQLGNVPPQRGA